jgi:hypothetical protein
LFKQVDMLKNQPPPGAPNLRGVMPRQTPWQLLEQARKLLTPEQRQKLDKTLVVHLD